MPIPLPDGAVQKRKVNPWLAVLLLFILVSAIGSMLGLLRPSVREARQAWQRQRCTENLRRIGIAIRLYHQKYGQFPPSFIPDKNGKPMHSWRVLILPFLGEEALYAKYRFDQPWNSPGNMALAGQMPAVYRCPSGSLGRQRTSYLLLVGPHAISHGPTSRRMSDVKGREDKTIMVAEVTPGVTWLEPRDLNVEHMLVRSDVSDRREPHIGNELDIAAAHGDKINVLFCDGAVDSIIVGLGENAMKRMFTIDGSEGVKKR
jgi:prepilin-type processing-associated H-X9-DG protein